MNSYGLIKVIASPGNRFCQLSSGFWHFRASVEKKTGRKCLHKGAKLLVHTHTRARHSQNTQKGEGQSEEK